MCSIITILSVFIIILVYNLNKKKCEHFDDGSMYKGYTDLLKDYKNTKYTTGGIPKIIFKTSWQKRNELPEAIHDVLKTTMILNPEYQLYYFDDDDVVEFMKAYSERAYNAYKKLKPGAFKADLFRYCVLEKYGGCYSDIGHMMHVSFDKICEDNKLILVKERFLGNRHYGIHNALMCATPHHPYMIKLLEECIKNIEASYYGYDSLCITGPILAGTVFYKVYDTNNDLRENYDFKNETEEVNKEMFNKHIKVGTRNNIKLLQLDDKAETISDINNKIILQRKFKDYYNIMYHDHKRTRYDEDWRNKNVYN